MQQEFLKSFDDYSKSAISASKELIDINSRVLNKVLETQITLANLAVEGGEKQLDLTAGSSTDPKAYVTKQTALIEELAAKLGEIAQANAKFAQEAQEDLKVWFEKGVATADNAVKEVAESAAKAA